jgi:hypothetical protein
MMHILYGLGKYNDGLLRRTEVIGDLAWILDRDSELERMNAGNKERPYEFPDSPFRYCAVQMHFRNAAYRAAEGDLRCILKAYGKDAPDHSIIETRCAELDWPMGPPAYPQTTDAAAQISAGTPVLLLSAGGVPDGNRIKELLDITERFASPKVREFIKKTGKHIRRHRDAVQKNV